MVKWELTENSFQTRIASKFTNMQKRTEQKNE